MSAGITRGNTCLFVRFGLDSLLGLVWLVEHLPPQSFSSWPRQISWAWKKNKEIMKYNRKTYIIYLWNLLSRFQFKSIKICKIMIRARHATPLPRQRDHVCRPKVVCYCITIIFVVATPVRNQDHNIFLIFIFYLKFYYIVALSWS